MSYDDEFEADVDQIEEEVAAEQKDASDKPESSMKGKLTVTLDVDQWMNGSLEEHVISKLVVRLSETLHDSIKKTVEARILAKADAEFDKLAQKYIEDYFAKKHRKTNSWGEYSGAEITIREMLTERFELFLNQKVDSKGSVTTYSDGIPRYNHMMNVLAFKPLNDAVNETVKSITVKAKEQIQQSVSRYIAEQLSPTITVPTLGTK